MTKRNEDRKRAYDYVKERAKRWNLIPPIDSDERLADVLMVSMSEVQSLKEGLSDPSPKLIKEFKDMTGPLIREDEIDSYLVTPFFP